MDAPRFELFVYRRNSATDRVRVALNLKGLAAFGRIVDLDAEEQRGEAFLRINPLGAIPALIDREAGGAPPITQSLPILEFLGEVPDTPTVDCIFAACEAHPAFADAAPMRQVGAPS